MHDIQRLLELKENFSSTNRPIKEMLDELYAEIDLLKKEQIAQKEWLDYINTPTTAPYVALHCNIK